MKQLGKYARRSQVRQYQLEPTNCVIKVQLVDIDFYPGMSEETLAFNATLHIHEDRKIYKYDCSNDGKGGSTNIRPRYCEDQPEFNEHCRTTLQNWEKYLSTQRDDKFYEVVAQYGWDLSEMKEEAKKSAESEVNDLLAEWCDKHDL